MGNMFFNFNDNNNNNNGFNQDNPNNTPFFNNNDPNNDDLPSFLKNNEPPQEESMPSYIQNNELNKELIEKKNRSGDISKIMGFSMIIISLCAAGYVLYQAYINKKRTEIIKEKDVPVEVFQKQNIQVTDELIQRLRALIPTYKECDVYYDKQFLEMKFLDSSINVDDLNTKTCQNLPSVYYANINNTSDTEYVYIYDVVLLYNNATGYYGKYYGVYNIEYDDIEIDVDEKGKGYASVHSLETYGQIYRYTFKNAGDNLYIYISTEPIYLRTNQEEPTTEQETGTENDLPTE